MKDNKDHKEVEVFEDEKKILLDHDYDGIRELDHPLPKWWLYTFYITILFAIPYWAAYTFFGAETINDEFKESVAKVTKIREANDLNKDKFNLDEYKKVITGPKIAKIGKKTYKRKCRACHGKVGQGGVGPNLTDNFWIHGDGGLESTYKVIDQGVTEKGMPAWGETLGRKKVYAVLKYISDFKGTNPPDGKAPQGKEIK